MLSFQQYKILSVERKAHLLWHEGVYLSSRKHNNRMLELYEIYGFFAEIWFTKIDHIRTDNMIWKIHPFRSTSLLEPYLPDYTFFDTDLESNFRGI